MKKEDLLIDGLYKITSKDIKRCAQVAAMAFLEDESCKYILNSGLTLKSLYEYYLVIYKAAFDKMYMFAESENINGLIVFTPLKSADLSVFDCIKQGALKIIFNQGLGILFRSLEYEKNCIKMRKNIEKENPWYIFQFCVIPSMQGKKFGSRTIKPFLKWLDCQNIGCCLETQKAVNVEIYKHFGFYLNTAANLSGSSVKQFSMFRNC